MWRTQMGYKAMARRFRAMARLVDTGKRPSSLAYSVEAADPGRFASTPIARRRLQRIGISLPSATPLGVPAAASTRRSGARLLSGRDVVNDAWEAPVSVKIVAA